MIKTYNIYTDGSARNNGKENSNGGFATVIFNDNKVGSIYTERHEDTTNNRMELMAILHAFEIAEYYPDDYWIVNSDSMYCVNICNDWIHTWAQNNWHNSKKQIVENLDLIQQLYKYITTDFFNAEVVYCGGHRGIIGNDLADALATNNMGKYKRILKENNIEEGIMAKIMRELLEKNNKI